jgi:hypothetical protein
MQCFRLILLICTLMVLGCKRENPNPELIDPIYKFLVEQNSALKSSLEGEKKKLEEGIKALEKTLVNTPERKIAIRDNQSTKGRIARLEQEYKYSEIRKERRRVEVRRDYKIAFNADKPWPNPQEFDDFMTQHRLRNASRNWNARVPRLQDRITAAWPKIDEKSKNDE